MIYTLLLPDDSLLSFDAVTEYSESYSANISSYETQVGFPITDNMTLNNPEYSFSGILSYYNSPTREIQLIDGEFQVVETSEEKPIENQVELEQKVKVLWEDKKPFSIIKSSSIIDIFGTELERIDYCLLSNLTLPEQSGVSGAIFPRLSITKVRMAVVVEEDVQNATPQLIKKDTVATQEQVKKAEEAAATAPDKGKPDEASTGITARTGNPQIQAAAQQTRNEIQSLQKYKNMGVQAQTYQNSDPNSTYFLEGKEGNPYIMQGKDGVANPVIPLRTPQ